MTSRARVPKGAFIPPDTRGVVGVSVPLGEQARGVATATTTEKGEFFQQQFPWPDGGGEMLIYTTSKQWRACDVYLAQSATQPNVGVWTMRVYALVAGMRVLVATGRLGPEASNIAPYRPIWIAAARGQASQFEVTLQLLVIGPPITPAKLTVGVACSNEANEPPPSIGLARFGPGQSTALATVRLPDPELVFLTGSIDVGVATPRFLHVHDVPNGTVIAGATPQFSFALGNAGGQGGSWTLNYRSISGFLSIFPSSTNDVTTIVADCRCSGYCR